jgi:xanthine dehydrogenase YagS FAD-binding subunit
MYPFTVSNPTTVADAATALGKGSAAILGGGTELLYKLKAMNSPATPPATLVNLKTISPSLSYIKVDGGTLKIGATTTLATIAASSTVQTGWLALAQAAGAAATPELRNVGTIGGNICQQVECWYFKADNNLFNCLRKDPKGICYALAGDNRYHSIFGGDGGCFAVNPSDTAPALLAFGASIVTNKQTYAAKDFWAFNSAGAQGYARESTTVLAPDEIVTEIQFPAVAAGSKSAFTKFALRKSFDFPVVNCAAVITQASGTVSAASIALNAVYNLPRKATEAETSISGKAINAANADAAGAATSAKATAMPANANTTTVGNTYMIQIAKVMIKRTILACA